MLEVLGDNWEEDLRNGVDGDGARGVGVSTAIGGDRPPGGDRRGGSGEDTPEIQSQKQILCRPLLLKKKKNKKQKQKQYQ